MRRRFPFLSDMILRAPEGGGGGADDPPPGGEVTPYRPEGLPDHLFGASERETIDKLYGAFKGFQSEASRRGPVPKDPKEYTFEAPDPLKPFFGDPNDQVMTAFRAAAHKHGIPQPAFEGLLSDTFLPLVEGGMLGPTFDPKAELDALGKMLGTNGAPADAKTIGAAVEEAGAFAEGLGAQLKLPDEAKGALAALADTAAGIAALRAIKGAFAERGLRLGGAPSGDGALSKEDLQRMGGDERIDPRSPKFDPAFRDRYDAGYRRLYGG